MSIPSTSDTPLTDVAIEFVGVWDTNSHGPERVPVVRADFARDLERKMNEARRQAFVWRKRRDRSLFSHPTQFPWEEEP